MGTLRLAVHVVAHRLSLESPTFSSFKSRTVDRPCRSVVETWQWLTIWLRENRDSLELYKMYKAAHLYSLRRRMVEGTGDDPMNLRAIGVINSLIASYVSPHSYFLAYPLVEGAPMTLLAFPHPPDRV